MNKETYVTYNQAQLLKLLGFDWKCRSCYHTEHCIEVTTTLYVDVLLGNYNNRNECVVSAPALHVAAKWLREVKKIHVQVWWNDMYGFYFADVVHLESNYINNVRHEKGNTFPTYEKALSHGITAALAFLGKEEKL